MTERKKLKLNDIDTSFLKVGRKVYAVREIHSDGLDIENELKEFYAKQYEKEVADVHGAVVNEISEEQNKQLRHIQTFRGRSEVKVPAELFNKPIVYWNAKFLELRCIIYSPYSAHTNRQYLADKGCQIDNDKFPRRNGRIVPTQTQLYVEFRPQFAIPLYVGFDKRTGALYTPFYRTFHTMGGYNVCTGNHSGRDFWTLSDLSLETNFNRINMFSPAQNSVVVGRETYHFSRLINNDTIERITIREGENQWTA